MRGTPSTSQPIVMMRSACATIAGSEQLRPSSEISISTSGLAYVHEVVHAKLKQLVEPSDLRLVHKRMIGEHRRRHVEPRSERRCSALVEKRGNGWP